ncbi:hypothetical protein [Salipaludibacillus aurantiacus]|uniref:hypothetical protein n=1 Tax=Salipaludibacillus aurantiacus TaxID=1601833 RepID=UPI0015A62BBD|nr:hypothetical protein [Salipaludibacillus aurantiacus]
MSQPNFEQLLFLTDDRSGFGADMCFLKRDIPHLKEGMEWFAGWERGRRGESLIDVLVSPIDSVFR